MLQLIADFWQIVFLKKIFLIFQEKKVSWKPEEE